MKDKTGIIYAVIGLLALAVVVTGITVGATLDGERSTQVRLACVEEGGIPGGGVDSPPCYYGKEGATP